MKLGGNPMLYFDIETDGLLPDVTKIHCLVVVKDEMTYRFNGKSIQLGLEMLEQHKDKICGQNIIGFDIPVIHKLYPDINLKLNRVVDTLVLSRVLFPNLKELDYEKKALNKNYELESKNFGSHSLNSWGQRLGFPKDDYANRMAEQGIDAWAEWSEEMEDYCVQDVKLTKHLYEKTLEPKELSTDCFTLEHEVADIIIRQSLYGFTFDVKSAVKLYGTLSEKRQILSSELKEMFGSWYVKQPDFIPKRDNNKKGYVKGVPVPRQKLVEFNPNSGDHRAKMLIDNYNWKPVDFTPSGKPKVDEAVLSKLDYPCIPSILDYMVVEKRIGQLAEGNKAWLKLERNGKLHGHVNTNGAVTGRMTHQNPNLANVVASYSLYGKECRSLFTVPTGHLLLGCDAEGLELRALAHYMAVFDGGKYADTVILGSKEKGTDAHSVNQRAIGLNSRDTAKTWFYAFIYGSGNVKLGSIIHEDKKLTGKPSEATLAKLGAASRARLLKSLPALDKLTKLVQKRFSERKYLIGLDGRRLYCRSNHSALNTLLQSAGAVIMKKALCILDNDLRTVNGYRNGLDYEFVANVHDEFQIEVKEELANDFFLVASASIKKAGEHYNFKCPLSGSCVVGKNWSETH